MKKEIILIGGGGHCKSCIDVIEADGKYKIAGIVDVPEKRHQTLLGYEIIASDSELSKLAKAYDNFLITLGHIKSAKKRIDLFAELKHMGIRLPVIKSPLAHVSEYARIGEGSIIMHQALVNAGAIIGKNCILNTKALIEHDVEIEDHCHIATGAILNGDSIIRRGTFVGSNSVIREGVEVGANSTIGLQSSIYKDLKEASIIK